MLGYSLKSSLVLSSFLILAVGAQAQGPRSVPVPVPGKRGPTAKKDRSAFPPVPTFKDIA
jgi:hypothetical protein